MPFNLDAAHIAPLFDKLDSGSQTFPQEMEDLISVLWGNKNVLKDLRNNVQALLEYTDIEVEYSCIDDTKYIHKDNFRFDDPAFYKATRITFLKFKLAEGVSEAGVKLEMLKLFMLLELLKCRYLRSCNFWGIINKPKPFLDPQEVNCLKQIIHLNKKYLSKYQFDWLGWTGIVYGVVGLATTFVPGFGILKGLLSAAFLFVAGVNVGACISYLRERSLFKVGYNKLQELKEDKIPHDKSIEQSLVVGENSKHWKGYFNSFLNWKTYSPKYYPYYAAGLYTGVYRLKDQKEAIKKLRPAC